MKPSNEFRTHRAGLPQGFVAFGTIAYMVLRTLHSMGGIRVGVRELAEELALPRDDLATIVRTLIKYEYVFVVGVDTHRDTGLKTQRILSLARPERAPIYRPDSMAERGKKYRERKALRAPTVFSFRGRVSL